MVEPRCQHWISLANSNTSGCVAIASVSWTGILFNRKISSGDNFPPVLGVLLVVLVTNSPITQHALKPDQWLQSPDELDDLAEDLTTIIHKGIDQSTPWARPSTYSKPGFTEECKEAQMRCRRLKRIWQEINTSTAREEYRAARNYKTDLIKREQRKAFRLYINDVCESPASMWKGTRWARDSTLKQDILPTREGGSII